MLQKILGKLGSPLKWARLSLILPLSFLTATTADAVVLSPLTKEDAGGPSIQQLQTPPKILDLGAGFQVGIISPPETIPTSVRLTQPVPNIAPRKPENLLIASSYQLDQLFNWAVFSSFPIVKEKQGYSDYFQAYDSAWWWFYYITTGPLRGPYFTINAGWIYNADLKGGGTANIRQYGSSGLWPTIDTLNHGTFGINAFVREVKFKY